MEMPHLLDIQVRAFEALLQLDAASHDREDIGLERVFKDLFPITDVHENFSLEFVRYSLGEPKYTVEECIERDMTYSAPLKATLQLVINEEVNERSGPATSSRRKSISASCRCSRRSARSSSMAPSASSSASCIVPRASCSRSPRTRTASASSRRASFRSAARGSSSPSTSTMSSTCTSTRRRSSRPPRCCARSATERNSRHSPPLLRRRAISISPRSVRAAPTCAKCSARSSPKTSRCRAKPRADDAPKARTKKAKAERERSENVMLVKEGDELTEEVFNRLRRQNIDTIKVFA